MRSVLLSIILAAVALQASAADVITKAPPVLKNIGGNVWEAIPDAGNTASTTRTWAKGTEVGSAKATDVFDWMYRQKHRVPITASRTVGAAAVGRVAAKLIPLVGPASLAYDIWQEIGCEFVDGQIRCSDTPDPFAPNSGQWVASLDQREPKVGYGSGAGACAARCEQAGLPPYGVSGAFSGAICMCVRPAGGTTNQGNVYQSSTCPAGSTPTSDGLCVPTTKTPKTEDEAADHWGSKAPNVPGYADKVPGIVEEGVGVGVPVPSGPPQLSGPPSVSSPGPSTTTTLPNGTTTTTNTTNTVNIIYNGSQVIVNEVSTTTNSDGTVTETTDQPFPEWLCGVAGMPDCNVKVNEADTPEWEQPDNSALDEIKAADAAKMNDVAQTIPEPDLGWFDAPPLAACRPYPLPNNMGEIDACAVVDSVRAVMAYLWALVAAWMAFGWIRQAVNGG